MEQLSWFHLVAAIALDDHILGSCSQCIVALHAHEVLAVNERIVPELLNARCCEEGSQRLPVLGALFVCASPTWD